MYTDHTFLHRVVNNLLRLSNDPLELFYLQPVVSDLFEAISDLFRSQKHRHKYRK